MMQLPLWEPESSWRPPSMADLPSWRGAARVGLDTETKDEHLKELGIGTKRGAHVVGISFAIEDGPKHYLPIRHEGGDNLDEKQVLSYLREQARDFPGIVVGNNISYDIDHLLNDGVEFKSLKCFRDIQIADPLIYELHNSYSLKNIAERWGLPGKNEDLLNEAARAFGVDPKSGMYKMPARYVGAYAEDDAVNPLAILRRQERQIEEKNLWEIFDLESQVLPILVKMRRNGVAVNMEKLRGIEEWSIEQEGEALRLIKDQTGVTIRLGDVWKAAALAPALKEIGMNLPTTSQGKISIDKDLLVSTDHPVTKAMAWARKTNKLRTTFAASLRRYICNGRIHTTFNQIARETESGDQKGARYGRLSSVHPNMQQQPSRDEFAEAWRSVYEPDEGKLWASLDYSQQEPRWTTHFAALLGLPAAAETAQAYHDDPDLDNHQFMSDLIGIPRKYAKEVYLGLCYGKGGAKLCDELGLPTRWSLAVGAGRDRRVLNFETQPEAYEARQDYESGFIWRSAGEEGQRILDAFDNRAPFIRKLANRVKDTANKRGHIITYCGRHLHFPQKDDGSYDWLHKSLNRLIQGTSADQTKKAIVLLDDAGYYLQLQVHDELGQSVENRRIAEEMAEIMENCLPALVPFRVDIEIGSSWGEAK